MNLTPFEIREGNAADFAINLLTSGLVLGLLDRERELGRSKDKLTVRYLTATSIDELDKIAVERLEIQQQIIDVDSLLFEIHETAEVMEASA